MLQIVILVKCPTVFFFILPSITQLADSLSLLDYKSRKNNIIEVLESICTWLPTAHEELTHLFLSTARDHFGFKTKDSTSEVLAELRGAVDSTTEHLATGVSHPHVRSLPRSVILKWHPWGFAYLFVIFTHDLLNHMPNIFITLILALLNFFEKDFF